MAVSAKHLFVAGAASHGRDRYRYKASGGFIHGFRFNCRTLWRLLEARYEDELPTLALPLAGLDEGLLSFSLSHSRLYGEPLHKNEWK